MLPKMTDTFDIQMNNTFTTKFAHQCKFISALHAIIPINNSMGPEANSHHDKFPPWWESVRDDDGGNLSVTKSHH